VQSVPITTMVVSLNPVHGKVYLILVALCDIVCQLLVIGRWFSPDTTVSSTNKTDCHDITEILLKEVFNTINQPIVTFTNFVYVWVNIERSYHATQGDAFNLFYLYFQIYLAVYFVFADLILFAQYLWYRRTKRMQMKRQENGLSFLAHLTIGSLRANPFARSPGQVKLDSDK